ncbi:hypothetical protein RI129_004634 [Pyrocoelia pectoralis]|uniref:NodB homology domain-containing protein n=1 Tax=Pyrocoelia pectoralis TaxID=417401 RepID=A0AAN7VD90_9COLE
MNFLVFGLLLCFLSTSNGIANQCGTDCTLASDCVCASVSSPIDNYTTPQLIALTFDESPNAITYQKYLSKLLLNRVNPDGNPISATFYITHQYTDYTIVNRLYNDGFEIGAHSVTKGPVDYWMTATEELLEQEFGDNVKITSKFANIPSEEILGVRTPHLQLVGDKSFKAFTKVGFTYDNSWTALSQNPAFPFTAEYRTTLPCQIGSCPIESYPHFWVLPIINLKGIYNNECNAILGCMASGTAEEVRDWLMGEFNRIYENNRAPMTLMLSTAWFQSYENTFEGLELFLNELSAKNDVFLVSAREVVNWARNPVSYQYYRVEHNKKNQECKPRPCFLKFGNQERIMHSCVDCPRVYPWLNIPDGNSL